MSNNNIAKMTTNNNSVNTPNENANKWRSFREVSPTHDTILQRKSDRAPPESPGFSVPRCLPPDVPSVVSPDISTNTILDTNAIVWQTKIEIATDQYEKLGKYIKKMKEESKLPIYLQGKSSDEKNKIIDEKVYQKIKTILSENNLSAFNFPPSIENIQKISDMIMENNVIVTILDNDKQMSRIIINAINDATKTINHCNPTSSKDEYEVDSVNDDKSVTRSVTDKPVTNKVNDKSEWSTKSIFSKNVYLSLKEALNMGQDKFFEEFTLTEDKIKKIKNDMSKSTEKKIEIHRVNIDNDEIVIDTYKFSKKHYFAQKWFVPKIINYYRENFNENFITVGKSVNTVTIKINI